MTAEVFFYQFIEKMKETNKEGNQTYLEIYKGKPCDPFTNLMNGNMIPEILTNDNTSDEVSFGLEKGGKVKDTYQKASAKDVRAIKCSHEYFRLDVAAWCNRTLLAEPGKTDLQAKSGLKYHLWELRAAVEHENNETDWTDELIKLCQLKCPLKIVIGYALYSDRDGSREAGTGDYAKLLYAEQLIHSLSDYFQPHQEEFLIILGNCGKECDTNYDKFDYRGYLYNCDTHRFDRLEIEN